MPFCADVFGPDARIAVELAWGADLTADPATWSWTDVTTYVRQADGQKISISPMGRGDETSKSQPAGCSFEVDNTTGDFSRKNPAGRWWPNVRRNTPLRVRLTLDGSSWSVRFQGQVNGFTPGWDTTANIAIVTVSASGKLRQLQQGKSPLKSPLYRAVTALTPVAHWSFEDGTDATQAGSAVTGVEPLTVFSGTATFGGDTHPLGATAATDVVNAHLVGTIPTRSSQTGWGMFITFRLTRPTVAGALIVLLSWTTANGYNWAFLAEDDGTFTEVSTTNAPVTLSVFGSSPINFYDGEWHTLAVLVTPVNANTTRMDMWLDGVHDFDTASPHVFSPLGGGVRVPDDRVFVTQNTDSVRVSHLGFFEAASLDPTDLISAVDAWVGETATDRIARLCSEEGVPVDITGVSDTTMGAQTSDTFVNLVRECETTDDGVLYDGRGPGLRYVARAVRYNAAASLTVDVSAEQLGDPFTPVDDDQRNRNLFTVSRKNGSSATYEDNFSDLGTQEIGTYDDSLTVNTEDDSGLGFRAAHEVHKGTVDAAYRYPTLNLELAGVPEIAPAWLLAEVSARVDVTNVSDKATQHPPGDVDLLLEGWSEQLSPFTWTATGNCSSFQPWRVGVIEGAGDTTWRIDSGASTLAADADVGATSLTVAVTDGYLWSTSAADYPRSVEVGGIEVNVTAVSGAGSPQTFTVDPLPYRLTAGSQVRLWHPPTIAL